jgi:hypothetical protein
MAAGPRPSTLSTVLNQCNDLLKLHQFVLDRKIYTINRCKTYSMSEMSSMYRELEMERLRHNETKSLLEEESHKLHNLDAELNVLQRQLTREKMTFEKVSV